MHQESTVSTSDCGDTVARRRASRSELGATMIEYSLVAAIMVTGLITGVYLLRQNMSQAFSSAGSAVVSQ